jgi:mono/diheme cytochrome c family protein
MHKSLPVKKPSLAVIAAVAVGLLAAGCGTEDADTSRGRVLFVQKCGTCHVLAQAGSTAQTGPDLDHAFAAARAAGMDSDTIEGIVATQIQFPRPSTTNPAVSMPADLVTGQDVIDVAAYVAEYAGVPGAAPPKVPGGPGAQVFANFGCGGCHTFAAANSGGTVGPNLDEVLAGQTPQYVETAITDPNAQQTPGFPLNVMPQDYQQQISPQELDDLVQFLLSGSGGGSQGRVEGASPDAPASAESPGSNRSGSKK